MPQYRIADNFTKPELERALLASIVQDPEVYWEIVDLLPTDAVLEMREAYEQAAAAVQKNMPMPMIEGEPAADPIVAAKELAELYKKRLLADVVQEVSQSLHGGGVNANEIISGLEAKLVSVQQAVRELQAGQMVTMPELFTDLLKETKERYETVKASGAATIGIPTGISKLDKALGGLQPGVHILAAEPGMGKTSITLQMAAHVSQKGIPVIFVSFEESLQRLALKAICQVAGLQAKQFADGQGMPQILQQAIEQEGHKLANLHMIEGSSKTTIAQVKAKALQVMNKAKSGRCLVIVDYLQRWASIKKEFLDFRHIVSGMVSELRELSMRLNSPVLVISSQNRSGQGAASLTSLKESGDLEYSADTALFLVESERMASPPARAVTLSILKNRYGDKGKVELIFRPDIGSFRAEEKQ